MTEGGGSSSSVKEQHWVLGGLLTVAAFMTIPKLLQTFISILAVTLDNFGKQVFVVFAAQFLGLLGVSTIQVLQT